MTNYEWDIPLRDTQHKYGRIVTHGRIDKPDGEKDYWYSIDGKSGLNGMPKADIPLYGWERLKEEDHYVVITEGEKAADALLERGVVAVGTVTGANGTPCDESLKVLLGRKVILWADHDDVGYEHMDRIGKGLFKLGADDIRSVNCGDAPHKGDAADFTGDHTALMKLLETAMSIEKAAIEADKGDEKQKQSTLLINLAQRSGAEFFHTPENEPFATFRVAQHFETSSLKAQPFRLWLARLFYEEEGQAISNNAMQEALSIFSSMAIFDGKAERVYLRHAYVNGRIYIDVCDREWRVIKIDSSGWHVVTASPVKFRRPKGMLALAIPEHGGEMSELRSFVNAVDDDDWVLLQAFLLGVWAPNPPYPVYNITGEQGSAKSTRARVVRRLTDPSVSPIGRAPKDDRDFAIAANNEWVVSFDNVSRLSLAHSDNLARLATGGGFRTRTLHTDTDQTILDAARPVILNGIADSITQDDLADRAITVGMRRILSTAVEPEDEFWDRFKQFESRIIGALCDAVSQGLKILPDTKLKELPRMADFARWVVACSGALDLTPEQFLNAYSANRNSSHEATLDASPIGPVLIAALEDVELYGTPQELLRDLFGRLDEKARKSKEWPSSGRALTNELKRIAPSLRVRGIAVERLAHQKSNRGVPWRIGPERKVTESSVTSVTATDLQLDLGDLTTDPAQSRLVTSVTPSSPKTDRSSVRNDSGDLSDPVNRQFSPDEIDSSPHSTPTTVIASRSGAEDWVNRKNGDQ